jgi:putative ABC transport system permease protein
MGIAQVQGRPVDARDKDDSPLVAVINETLARRYYPDRDPIGQYLIIESSPSPEISAARVERQIVGIVGDVRSIGPNPESMPVIYIPHTQAAVRIMNVVMKARGNPEDLLRVAERTAWGMGGDINVYNVETLSDRLTRLDWAFQASTLLLGAFAVLALILGAAGIYAVISYTVAKRTHEIGVRMALGAERGEVLRAVITNGMKLTFLGIGLGFLLSIGLSRLIARLLYGVATTDFATFASVALVLVVVAAGACLIPALRASRVDPIVALRYE